MTRIIRFAFGAAFLLFPAFGADPRWIRMPSADFEIFSSAGEGDTRRTLEYFRQVSSFFTKTMGSAPAKTDAIRIIVFGSKKEYEPYRPNEFFTAFYTQSGGRDYIVLSSASAEAFAVAVHEYTHLIVQHAGMKLPPWLNEGIAELYSTLRPLGGQVVVGDVIPGRLRALSLEKWAPLAAILAADRNSPYYNEKDKAGSLYNEGWALTHMLQLSDGYRAGFKKALEAIQTGTPSQAALESVYGRPLATIEKDLQSYIRGDRFKAAIFEMRLTVATERTAAEPVQIFDVKLALLDLTNRPGREAETRKKLEDLASEDARRPEPHVGLGYLAARTGQMEDARQSFAKAMELGSRNPQMLWDYGRMAAQADPPQSIHALSILLADQPARMDVRMTLARVQMNAKQTKDVLDTLRPVTKISAGDAPVLFRLRAFANLENGEREAARSKARLWSENAKEPEDRDDADRLLKYLDSRDQTPQSASTPAPTLRPQETAAPPQLVRGVPAQTETREAPSAALARPWLAGSFVEFDCSGPQPKLILENSSGRVAFLIDDPSQLKAFGNASVTEMNCGPQKHVSVWIEYDQPSAQQRGITGLARAIHFEPPPGQ